MGTTPTIKFKTYKNDARFLPVKGSEGAAGYDLCLRSEVNLELVPGEVYTADTGVFVEMPEGWAGLILPRSGLAAQFGLTVVNSPGLIDSDYRGEIKVILGVIKDTQRSDWGYNTKVKSPVLIGPFSRIAQFVPIKLSRFNVEHVESLSNSTRGEGGLGSTGV